MTQIQKLDEKLTAMVSLSKRLEDLLLKLPQPAVTHSALEF